ncbi:MAG TPA: OmpA family protein [Longimicrobiaceae bacterium]|nr:OmpA family protein [Longimicrobiaceae bacterium]
MSHTSVRSLTALLLAAVLGSGSLTGCASMNNQQKGAVIGATTGGVVGGMIGRNNGSTAAGAIIGATVGGVAGSIIGSRMDRQAEELRQEIPGATVERVGEGIAITFDSGILFDFNSEVLRGEARENLRNLATSLDRYPGTDLMIVGHTDNIGSAAYNQRLSERRAATAATFLASQGVARSRLQAVGRAFNEPVAENDSEWGRQQNRRVEIAIFANEAYREQVQRRSGD